MVRGSDDEGRCAAVVWGDVGQQRSGSGGCACLESASSEETTRVLWGVGWDASARGEADAAVVWCSLEAGGAG